MEGGTAVVRRHESTSQEWPGDSKRTTGTFTHFCLCFSSERSSKLPFYHPALTWLLRVLRASRNWELRVASGVPVGSYSLFLISFSSLRMRDDSCSGVGVIRDSELEPSGPEGGLGSLWRRSSSMLLCSLLFRP